MSIRPFHRLLLSGLLSLLLAPGCGRFRKPTPPPALAPAADPAVAAATKFSLTLIETDADRRGTIASGTLTLNAPLNAATGGTYAVTAMPSKSVLGSGIQVAKAFQSSPTGPVTVTHSGNLAILNFTTKTGDPILKIIGPPHGNAINDHWFHLGQDAGLATVSPRP